MHQAATGIYLGLVFAPNHKGMALVDASAPLDALRAQVLTARNVRAHPVVDWCYGGLNYQIEHHLFPALPRHRLRAASRLCGRSVRSAASPTTRPWSGAPTRRSSTTSTPSAPPSASVFSLTSQGG